LLFGEDDNNVLTFQFTQVYVRRACRLDS
jgi:hypothetical protein